VVQALVSDRVHAHRVNNPVDKIVVDVLGTLVRNAEVSATIRHHKFKLVSLLICDYVVVRILRDVELVEQIVVSLDNYLISVLHQPHFLDIILDFEICFACLHEVVERWREHHGVAKPELRAKHLKGVHGCWQTCHQGHLPRCCRVLVVLAGVENEAHFAVTSQVVEPESPFGHVSQVTVVDDV